MAPTSDVVPDVVERRELMLKRERILIGALAFIVLGLAIACGSPLESRRLSDDEAIANVLRYVRHMSLDDTGSSDCLRILESESADWTVSNNADGSYTVGLDAASIADERAPGPFIGGSPTKAIPSTYSHGLQDRATRVV